MYNKMTLHDLKKNKVITIAISTFVVLATLMISLAAMMLVTLSGSTEVLMEQAKTTHFLQMHSGEIDMRAVDSFSRSNKNVSDYQVAEFLNLENSKMVFGNQSLIDSVEDNGLSVQNEKFDYLLDLDGQKIQVGQGEVYVPVSYLKNGLVEKGDIADFYGKKLKVAGFLRDSQMNSTLSSSKRFLVSQSDFDALREFGNIEYLIEFRLLDKEKIGEFETIYIDSKLPNNGPTVTYPLFKLMNGLTDGIIIAILLLIALLVIVIGLLSIRFTLLTQLEKDMVEVGMLKAIGIRLSDIKKIYLNKYAILVGIGSLLGFTLSLVLREKVIGNIKLFMGEGKNAYFATLVALISVLITFLLILVYVNHTLKHLNKYTAVEMMNQDQNINKIFFKSQFRLTTGVVSANTFLGLKDILVRFKTYLTMFFVLIVATFIFIVPMKLHQTISSDVFSRYVGVGEYDFRMDIQQTDDIQEKIAGLITTLENDSAIEAYTLLTTKSFNSMTDKGKAIKLRVELGDHSLFPINYIEGNEPKAMNDIALSAMNADNLEKKLGDTLKLEVNGNLDEFIVCGIYSDLTNGGKTAKASTFNESEEVMWYTINGTLKNKENSSSIIEAYQKEVNYAKISDVKDFVTYVYGTTIQGILVLSYVGVVLSILLTILMMTLFIKMLIEKDSYEIATLKALGFTYQDIVRQYLTRFMFLSVISISIGVFLSNTLGQKLASLLISSFGVSSFEFSGNSWWISILCFLLLILAVLLTTIYSTRPVKKLSITSNIKE